MGVVDGGAGKTGNVGVRALFRLGDSGVEAVDSMLGVLLGDFGVMIGDLGGVIGVLVSS